jgi:hypothetical protein
VSSKGFRLRRDGLSEVGTYLEVARDHLTETLLVSAYDLHHGHLPEADTALSPNHWSTLYGAPSLLIVDSGGYELGNWWEEGDLHREHLAPLSFTSRDYASLLDRFPSDRDLLIVSYDHLSPGQDRPSIEYQLEQAAVFFDARRHMMSDVLLKPPSGHAYIDPVSLADTAGSLGGFDVVGVTEKELGGTLLDRLRATAALRRVLDEAEVQSPLHVFGVLDPLLVSLYFMAGAELFDGLTWLRYGYHEGLSVNRGSIALLDHVIDEPDAHIGARAQVEYLAALSNLKRGLSRWVQTEGDFSVLPFAADLEHVYDAMMRSSEDEGE